MSSPARQGNHSVSQAYSKGRSTNKINTKCERLQSKLIFNFLGIFSWYPLGRIRSKLYIAIILKNKEIIILQILQSIWKGPCSKCDIHYSYPQWPGISIIIQTLLCLLHMYLSFISLSSQYANVFYFSRRETFLSLHVHLY